MRYSMRWAVAAAAFLLPLPTLAQEAGTLYAPTQSAPIREEPPGGFWRIPGAELGKTLEGTNYIVLHKAEIQSGVGETQTWIEVAPVDTATGEIDTAGAGWVYFGTGKDSPNFAEVPAAQLAPELQETLLREMIEMKEQQ